MADESTLGLGLDDPAYQGLLTKQQEAITAANKPYGMNAGEGAIAAGLGLLPALIGGLVRGKEGIAIGADAGLSGLNQYDGILKNNYKVAADNNQQLAQNYGQQAQSVLQSRLQDQRFTNQEKVRQDNRIDLKQMFPNKGTNVTVNMPGGTFDKEAQKAVKPHLEIYQSFTQAIRKGEKVLKEHPELQKLNYGDLAGSAELLGKNMGAYFLGAETPLGELDHEVRMAAADYAKALTGLGQTDGEFERLFKNASGRGELPATTATMLATLRHIRMKAGEKAVMAGVASRMMSGMYKTPEEALQDPTVQGVNYMLKFMDTGGLDSTYTSPGSPYQPYPKETKADFIARMKGGQ